MQTTGEEYYNECVIVSVGYMHELYSIIFHQLVFTALEVGVELNFRI